MWKLLKTVTFIANISYVSNRTDLVAPENATWGNLKILELQRENYKNNVFSSFYFYSNSGSTWTWSVILSSSIHCFSPLSTCSHDLNLMTHDPYCRGLGIVLPNTVSLVSFYLTGHPSSIPISSCPSSFGGKKVKITGWDNNNLLGEAMR